jgi:hypothetical protein
VIQGLGHATMEELVHDASGHDTVVLKPARRLVARHLY